MYPPLLRLLLCLVCTAGAGAALAQKTERSQPMRIEADALRYDDLKQISVFTGNVMMTRGNVAIKGARVEVRQDPQGYQYGVISAGPGQRAFFRQQRDDDQDEFIEGESDSIEYDGRADVFKLIKNAQLRRLRGTQVVDTLSGGVIHYNALTDVFTVDGNPRSGQDRVRATLTPRNANKEAPGRTGLPLRNDNSLDTGGK